MILHSALLIQQSLVTVFAVLDIYIKALNNHRALINIVVTGIDLIVQLMIGYICLSMGSQMYLR
jgi:hypothetical protein